MVLWILVEFSLAAFGAIFCKIIWVCLNWGEGVSSVFTTIYLFCLLGFLLRVQQCGAYIQLLQLLHQISILVHLEQDVAAAHKLTVKVHLRDRGPVGEGFYSCCDRENMSNQDNDWRLMIKKNNSSPLSKRKHCGDETQDVTVSDGVSFTLKHHTL